MGFELRFTDKEITAWGGMGLMKRVLAARLHELR